jgi:RimJ/RimL family protein N-acetyltransferase
MKCRGVIESERLRLRKPERRDFPALVAAFNDWSIAQWLARPAYPFTDADAEAFLSWTSQPDANGFNGKFIIADRSSDHLLGVVTLFGITAERAVSASERGGLAVRNTLPQAGHMG